MPYAKFLDLLPFRNQHHCGYEQANILTYTHVTNRAASTKWHAKATPTSNPNGHDPSSYDPATHDPNIHDPKTHDPTTHDPETCDPKEARVQEARSRRGRSPRGNCPGSRKSRGKSPSNKRIFLFIDLMLCESIYLLSGFLSCTRLSDCDCHSCSLWSSLVDRLQKQNDTQTSSMPKLRKQ